MLAVTLDLDGTHVGDRHDIDLVPASPWHADDPRDQSRRHVPCHHEFGLSPRREVT